VRASTTRSTSMETIHGFRFARLRRSRGCVMVRCARPVGGPPQRRLAGGHRAGGARPTPHSQLRQRRRWQVPRELGNRAVAARRQAPPPRRSPATPPVDGVCRAGLGIGQRPRVGVRRAGEVGNVQPGSTEASATESYLRSSAGQLRRDGASPNGCRVRRARKRL
jgi:hypothetical protein